MSDHAFMEMILEPDELLDLTLHQARHGHAGPSAHHLGHILLVDLLLEHRRLGLDLVELLAGDLEAPLELGNGAIAKLGRLLEVGLALHLAAHVFELLVEVAQRGDGVLFGLPPRRQPVEVLGQVGELLVEVVEPLRRGVVGLLGQRQALDLELADAAFDHVDLGGHRIDLDPQRAARLVDQVDGLVGQKAGP